jgi:hypothetical protein
MAIENNSLDFSGRFIGTVLEVDIPKRRLAVYIPKLMPGIIGQSSISSQIETTSNPNVGALTFSPTINIRNSMWVYPIDYDEPLPKVGSQVTVYFIDNNPKAGHWDKFNPNQKYEVIDNEKYEDIFRLSIGSVSLDVKKEDVINIDIPDNLNTVLIENGKEKNITITANLNYVISDTQPENPFIGMLWFDTDEQKLYIYKDTSFKEISISL